MPNSSSPLSALSIAYAEALEARYKADPDSIDPQWRSVFDDLGGHGEGGGSPRPDAAAAIVAAYREHGHLAADLDPLRLATRSAPPAAGGIAVRSADTKSPRSDNAELIERLRSRYCGTLAVETAHIDDLGMREWIYDAFENCAPIKDTAARRRAMELLIKADEFERFMAVKFPAKKRFGAEGAEVLVPMLDRLLQQAALGGVTDVVIGSMHRGRLNIAANVLGKPLTELLAEFKGAFPFQGDQTVVADVSYHLGLDTRLALGGHSLQLVLSPNPSHLEAVKPVVLGRTRARQDLARDRRLVLGVLIHTDASVVAQGIVAETLQLSKVPGFDTAGTIHIVVNNQIGFTTEQGEARSSRYCTGPWKAVDSLILHANGDDPDAALCAADLAFAFRQAHGRDAVIDLVCYRRNGHNEIDEPRFTQPLVYRAVDSHPSVVSLFSSRLVEDGTVSAAESEALASRERAALQDEYKGVENFRAQRSGFPGGAWSAYDPAVADAGEPDSGVELDTLRHLLSVISSVPDHVAVSQKVERIVHQRAQSASDGVPWAVGEALAFATLLAEGTAVRLSGQDVVRGAFSHRHFALTDIETGRRHISLNHLGVPQARFDVINSPLSEYAVLGFEYGYSVERPDALVIWEAQFGDFANGAQIIIDQFITSGEEKWQQPSGLVMLLPHGLEGQGPEHSSARIERYLQLAARNNVQIVQPSTPANYFHLLRRQVSRQQRKPLIVMSPKTLLRLPAAVSPLAAFGPDTVFHPVLATSGGKRIRAVLLGSGKIAYDLERERDSRAAADVAIVRVEQLYPFPTDALLKIFREWPAARFAWVQEESRNMGAWNFVDRRLEMLLQEAGCKHARVACFSRPESPSPAGSFHGDHDKDQRRVVEQAFQWATEQAGEAAVFPALVR